MKYVKSDPSLLSLIIIILLRILSILVYKCIIIRINIVGLTSSCCVTGRVIRSLKKAEKENINWRKNSSITIWVNGQRSSALHRGATLSNLA